MTEAVLASVNDTARVEAYLRELQSRICQALEALDGSGQFAADPWTYAGGGGGTSRILQSGQVFEKAGVNFSAIHGVRLPPAATVTRTDLNDLPFSAMGVSLVIHPWNPHVPTTHMNVRFIRVDEHKWWFGGGFDLTPYYGYVEDAVHWHQVAARACEGFGTDLYPRLKRWCDEYFFIKHRGEARGIGGIFTMILPKGALSPVSPSCKVLPIIFLRRTCRLSSGAAHSPMVNVSANFNACAAGAMSSLTWCTIAVHCLGYNPVAEPSPS